MALAQEMPGFLGVESVRDETGLGITSVYWKDKESIEAWRDHAEHKKVKKRGRAIWYENYFLRIAKVEKNYGKIYYCSCRQWTRWLCGCDSSRTIREKSRNYR